MHGLIWHTMEAWLHSDYHIKQEITNLCRHTIAFLKHIKKNLLQI